MYLWSWVKSSKYRSRVQCGSGDHKILTPFLKSKETSTCCHFLKKSVQMGKKDKKEIWPLYKNRREKNTKYKSFAYSATLTAWLSPGSRGLRLQTHSALPKARSIWVIKRFPTGAPNNYIVNNTNALETQIYPLLCYSEIKKKKVDHHWFLSEWKMLVTKCLVIFFCII